MLIEEGMVIKNHQGYDVLVKQVVKGNHGILVNGTFIEANLSFQTFVPFELPPEDFTENWYNWENRAFFILASGIKVGTVTFAYNDPCQGTIEEYDIGWERTIEAIRKEEQDDNGTV